MDFILEINGNIVTKLDRNVKEMNFLSTQDITKIGENACTEGLVEYINMSLTNIIIIGHTSFARCSNLKEVIFPESLREIGANAFLYTKLVNIKIPKNVELMSGYAWNQIKTLESFYVDPENENFTSINGCLFDKSKTKLLRATNNITKCSDIPNFKQITTIGEFSFTEVPLTSFIAEKELISVESYGFHAMGQITFIDLTLSQIKCLPAQLVWSAFKLKVFICPFLLEEISTNAFYILNQLEEIVIFSHLITLQEDCLYNCTNLERIIYYGINNFSNIDIVSGSTNKENIHVYTLSYYIYQYFGQIEVENIKRFTCGNNQYNSLIYISRPVFCYIFLIL